MDVNVWFSKLISLTVVFELERSSSCPSLSIVGGEHHNHRQLLFTMYLLIKLTVNPAKIGSRIGVIYTLA